MALVTVQRSPVGAHKRALLPQGELNSRQRLRKRDSFLMCQGSALLFATVDDEHAELPDSIPETGNMGALRQHMELMCDRLQQDHTITLAVRLESVKPHRTPYFVMVSNTERLNVGENLILGMDIIQHRSEVACTIGLVLPVWSDTQVFLDGDGGFSLTSGSRTSIFKPISVQVMWTVLQTLHKACEESSYFNLFPGGSGLLWADYYMQRIDSKQTYVNEWNTMSDLLSVRPPSPQHSTPTDQDVTELLVRSNLRVVMADMDLDQATSRVIRTALEQRMQLDLKEYKGFIENEIMLVLAQMDKPSKIFHYLYLGSEWNASNFEELEQNRVGYILNVTREIDNFFPAQFKYLNIRVYDEESTDLLSQWEQTYRFINTARSSGLRCLVHCKMGVSRSASTVIAYTMKQYGWDLEKAFAHVKERRSVVKPNSGFLSQLRIYQGILNASKQRHNFLWRSCSETDLTDISKEPKQGPAVRRSQDDSETGPRRSRQLHRSPGSLSPSGLSPRPNSPSGLSPRHNSPSALSPGSYSPSGLSPRPNSPSGLSPRPNSPSGLSPGSHSPSGLSPRPNSPSGLSPRPDSPSGLSPRPNSPSGLSAGPHSPSGPSPEPHSPSGTPPRPPSPSGTPPAPGPTSSYHFRPLGEQSDKAPAASVLLPCTPSISVEGAPLPERSPPGRESSLCMPEPLAPSLRKKLDLLTLMGQVKEMERLQEALESTAAPAPQRARAWRRRAYSVQALGVDEHDWSRWKSLDVGDTAFLEGPGRDDVSWPRSPGATPQKGKTQGRSSLHHLHQCQAVDLPEEDEVNEGGHGDAVPEQTAGLEMAGAGHSAVEGGGTAGRNYPPRKAAPQHRHSVAALQESALVLQRMKHFAEGGPMEGLQGEGAGS